MRAWAILLGGLTVWAAHFFALYAIASILPGQPEARWLALAATVPAILADGLLVWRAAAWMRATDQLHRSIGQISAVGAALSLIAVIWQALPALLT
jgi:hypothetical protein